MAIAQIFEAEKRIINVGTEKTLQNYMCASQQILFYLANYEYYIYWLPKCQVDPSP